ncbi:hypothetical protein LMH87_000930 [Akanthomyces muscarius]|uniref:Uncharacterized protein n=1 Tax=Akanthomyces muscarius TaxID=2231603 RepID=A0A9W8QGB7_AKAMU|nr:hypothetical protein LMH87_000930 [Akanthomyces muscarius]KAJ4155696.1 hypothetical protein LMH87_000930 [Akanthomyces muscarius]
MMTPGRGLRLALQQNLTPGPVSTPLNKSCWLGLGLVSGVMDVLSRQQGWPLSGAHLVGLGRPLAIGPPVESGAELAALRRFFLPNPACSRVSPGQPQQ